MKKITMILLALLFIEGVSAQKVMLDENTSNFTKLEKAKPLPSHKATHFMHRSNDNKGTVLDESFETWPPTDWSVTDWSQSSYGSAHTGSEWAYSNTAGSELVSPLLNINNDQYELKFWYRAESFGHPQDMDVHITTDLGNLGTAVHQITGATNTTYNEVTIDMSGYNGQSVYVVFVGQSGTGGFSYGICVDDVYVGYQDPYQFALITPTGKEVRAGATHYYSVGLQNSGSSNDTYDLSFTGSSAWNYNFYDVDTSNTIVTIDLEAGQDTTFLVEVSVPGAANTFDTDTENITVTSQGNTSVHENFDITTTALNQYALFADFNDEVIPPTDWEQLDNSLWQKTTTAYEGSFAAYSYDGGDTLVTPKLDIVDGDALRFYGRNSSFNGGTMDILISSDKENWSSILSLITPTGNLTSSYQPFEANFTAAEAGIKHIAFVNTSEYFYLDYVIGPDRWYASNDLAVTELLLPTNPTYDGDVEDIGAVIENKGLNPIPASGITFSEDGAVLGSQTTSHLDPGQTDTVYYSWTASPGSKTISAEVPADDNPSNDYMEGKVVVVTGNQLYADFNDGVVPPNEWVSTEGVVSQHEYGVYEGDYHSYVSNAIDTLITPKLDIVDGDSLTFWLKGSGSFEVLISPDKTSWTSLSIPTVNSDYTRQVVSLGAAEAGSKYLAFAFNASSFNYLYIDFVIGPNIWVAADDAGIVSIDSPGKLLTPSTSTTDVNVTLENLGSNTLTNVDIEWEINGVNQGTYSWIGSLNSGETESVNLGSYLFVDTLNEIKAYTELPNGNPDEKNINDTTTNYTKLVETFDNFLPNGWTEASGHLSGNTIFSSGTSDWTYDDYLNDNTHPYGQCAKENLYSTEESNWLLSPVVDLGSTTQYQLEFDLAVVDYGNSTNAPLEADDTVAVVISPDGGTTWSTSNIEYLLTIDNTPLDSGEHAIIDLSGYSGNIQVGFYTASVSAETPTEDNDIMIDNVKFTEKLTASGDGDWSTVIGTTNNFTSVTIPAGNTITIPSTKAEETCANLTVEPGGMITIEGTLNVISDVNILSDGTSQGSLIDHGTLNVGGLANVEQYLTSGGYWYISPQVQTANAGDDLLVDGTDYRIWEWVEGAGATINDCWQELAGGDDLNPLQGYAYSQTSGSPVTGMFTGDLNTGAIGAADNVSRTAGTYYEGFNLVGNPYPSAIDWGTENTPTAGLTIDNLINSIYVRKNDGTFSTYNWSGDGTGVNGGTQYIAPGQAVWVKVDDLSTTGTYSVTNDTRLHNTDPIMKTGQDNVFRLTADISGMNDELAVGFYDKAQESFDKYDSEKMMMGSQSNPSIYTITDGYQLAINGMPANETDKVIPVGYKLPAGTVTLNAYNISDFNANMDVFLRDKYENVLIDLREENSYTFDVSESTTITDRFELVFGAPTGISEEAAENIHIFANNSNLYLNSTISSNAHIRVTDVLGRVAHDEITELNKGMNSIELNTTNGVYIVTIECNNKVYTEKVVIK